MRLADTLSCVMSQKLVPSLDGKLVLAKEMMIMTPSVRAAIKNNNTGEIYQMMAESADLGMVTLEQDLKRLYMQKKISLETIVQKTSHNVAELFNIKNRGFIKEGYFADLVVVDAIPQTVTKENLLYKCGGYFNPISMRDMKP